ncbi:MAG: dethiobiotin synthase [Myxococcales bacterium]|nr:dethiobiotin synthase [Myxococcales bacterium]
MSGYFVTGTDTGVGKTFVTCAIAAALRRRGRTVGVFKPAETGCEERAGELVASDAAALLSISESGQSDAEVCPVRFRDPAAPLAAAEAAGEQIDASSLVRAAKALADRFDPVLVEGAGGLLVPLARDTTYADFASALGFPVLVVVGAKLGCINHALLTFEVLARRGLSTVGWILNEVVSQPGETLAHETHRELIERFSDLPYLGHLPHVAPGSCQSPSEFAALGEAGLKLGVF